MISVIVLQQFFHVPQESFVANNAHNIRQETPYDVVADGNRV